MKKNFLILLTIILAFSITGCKAKEEQTEIAEEEKIPEVSDEEIKDFESMYIMKDGLPQLKPNKKDHPVAMIETSEGTMAVILYPEYAPKTVENFIALSNSGYYNGVTFHRVMKDFMIQGGDPDGTGSGGQSSFGAPFEDEFSPSLYNIRGALSMANSGANTNGSQFFIVQNNLLDGGYLDTFENLLNESIADTGEIRYYKAHFNEFVMPGSQDYLVHSNVGIPKVIMEKYIEVGGTPHLDYKHTVFGQVIDDVDAEGKAIKSFDVLDKIAKVETDTNAKPLNDVVINQIVIIEPQS